MTYATVASLSHFVAAIAFLALTVLVAISWRRGPVGAWLVVAAAATVIWSGASAEMFRQNESPGAILALLEVVRTGGWLAFLIAVLSASRGERRTSRGWMTMIVSVGALCVGVSVASLIGDSTVRSLLPDGMPNVDLFGRLLLAVIGVLMVENLLRNTPSENRWAIKFLCFGIGGLFFYDFFLYADALLFYRVSPDLIAARGVTNALIVPLIAISARRNPNWSIDVFVSRQVVFHSATLIGAGAYLLLMAAAGFYIREFGGEWGTVFEAAFLFAAVLGLLSVVFSGAVRARLKEVISKHFFSYKYDYRDEWLRFISTISSGSSGVGLPQRILEGVGNLVESPQGAIWISDRVDRLVLLETWNLNVPEGSQTADPSFSRFLEERQTVINMATYRANRDAYPGLVMPDWLSELSRAWLIVPLLHHDRLLGFILLAQSRAARAVGPEDYVLLTTVGRQAASYLAERESARALAESQQFDEFNRRFAFVLHDIKNLVSQLSLLVQNSEKHKNNPAFQEDMLETVKESVDKMNRLLVRLHESGKETASSAMVDLSPLLNKVVSANSGRAVRLQFEAEAENIAVVADEERLCAVISHLVDNAFDAVGDDGLVVLRLGARGGDAVIEVEDNGPGMAEDFVRNELFRPFRTTKSGGFGIGAFESREFVRECGGRMDVISEVGRGTTIRVSLPATSPASGDGQIRHAFGVE